LNIGRALLQILHFFSELEVPQLRIEHRDGIVILKLRSDTTAKKMLLGQLNQKGYFFQLL